MHVWDGKNEGHEEEKSIVLYLSSHEGFESCSAYWILSCLLQCPIVVTKTRVLTSPLGDHRSVAGMKTLECHVIVIPTGKFQFIYNVTWFRFIVLFL